VACPRTGGKQAGKNKEALSEEGLGLRTFKRRGEILRIGLTEMKKGKKVGRRSPSKKPWGENPRGTTWKKDKN